MSARDDTERLRRLAKSGDRGARDELVRHLQRHNGLDNQPGTVYRVQILEDAERCRVVDLMDAKIIVMVHDLRLLAHVLRKTVDHVEILVVPIWGEPPRVAPRMDLTFAIGKRRHTVLVGGS